MATETIRERLAARGWEEKHFRTVSEGKKDGRLIVYTTSFSPDETVAEGSRRVVLQDLIPEGARIRMGEEEVTATYPAPDTLRIDAASGEGQTITWDCYQGIIAAWLDAEITTD